MILDSPGMTACPSSRASIRAQRRGQSDWGKSNRRPRLSRVIWRTCLPVRSEVTRRYVKYVSLADLLRVAVFADEHDARIAERGARVKWALPRIWHYKQRLE